ncbi:hypothetical protein CAPN001_02290 [Capnocytophaga stomatis]|nr:hypothetical protein CAPN002_17740 [Capnocytophaga stomatis]GIJ95660.1 hypothetical protein CAPN001_02290 [Capnocytophaga stomatis]GIM48959.1 hypothetical protein CAPN003_04110 [Capnocytophaga stomatis]
MCGLHRKIDSIDFIHNLRRTAALGLPFFCFYTENKFIKKIFYKFAIRILTEDERNHKCSESVY